VHAFIAYTIIGIVFGATYAVAASGLVVTYATSGIFNVAHGAIGMVMAFVYWQLSVAWHVPTALALFLTIFVIAPAFGALVEILLIRRVADASVTTTLVVTTALMVLLIGVANWLWGSGSHALTHLFAGHGVHFLGQFVTAEELLTVAAAVVIALGLRLFLYRLRVGVAMRAVVDNRALAGLNGARPARVGTLSWALGAMLAAVAGVLIAPTLQLSVLPLTLLVVNAYAAAMFGRLRSLPMTFLGALLLGLLYSYAVGYIPSQGSFWGSVPLQGLHNAIPGIALFVVLLVLPQERLRGAKATLRRVVLRPPSLGRSLEGGLALVLAVVLATAYLSPGNVVGLGIGLATALIMLSLVPLVGWGGQISLCQMTFAGLGAVAMARFGQGGSVFGLVAAAGLAGGAGALVSLPALRLRGLYLALATMAFAATMDAMFFPSASAFTFDGSVRIPRPALPGLHFHSQRSFVIFLAVAFSLCAVGLLALRRGPFGRTLAAMKDSEAACATLGLNLTLTKLVVFTLSAALAGVAGALFGAMSSVAGATDFVMLQSLALLVALVVGGVATCGGALFGGIALGFLTPLLQNQVTSIPSLGLLLTGTAGISLGANPDGIIPALYASAGRLWEAGTSRLPGLSRPVGSGGARPTLVGPGRGL
jgi:branched-chain amino acid transport system permease protein